VSGGRIHREPRSPAFDSRFVRPPTETAPRGAIEGTVRSTNPHAPPILVAEDDPSHALLIRKTFAAVRIANPLHVVEDGEAAIASLAGGSSGGNHPPPPTPVLALLDIHLPLKSGLEVLEWVRSQVSLKHLAVIMLSSSDQRADISRAYELGASSYLIKPVGFGAMQEVVRTLDLYWFIGNNPEEATG